MNTRRNFACILWIAATIAGVAGPVVEISNKEGKTLSAELISVGETSAKFKKTAGSPPFEVAFDTLSPETVAMLKKEAEEMPVVYPRFDVDVVVSKRRKASSGSYYMKSMTVGGKVVVSNQSMKSDFPVTKGRLVFIGQNQQTESVYQVLSVTDFEISPKAGKEQEIPVADIITTYDSDNKGRGNIGGYKYYGYLLIFHDGEGNVTYSKTLSGVITKAISDNPKVVDQFLTVAVLTNLTENMIPLPPGL